MNFLNGYKTYIVAAVAVLYAGVMYFAGDMDLNTAIAFLSAGAGGAALRGAVIPKAGH